MHSCMQRNLRPSKPLSLVLALLRVGGLLASCRKRGSKGALICNLETPTSLRDKVVYVEKPDYDSECGK